MKIFIVWGYTPDSKDIVGIFSTIVLAREVVEQYATDNYCLTIEEHIIINKLGGII